MSKFHANYGIPRNKKPLQNLLIEVEIVSLKQEILDEKEFDYESYKFKDLGYLTWSSGYEIKGYTGWQGFITPADLKEKLGPEQWKKFCEGKRKFIIPRRINGKNIKKESI
jgi:hypothetical protein